LESKIKKYYNYTIKYYKSLKNILFFYGYTNFQNF
jgi:hypothetical protein